MSEKRFYRETAAAKQAESHGIHGMVVLPHPGMNLTFSRVNMTLYGRKIKSRQIKHLKLAEKMGLGVLNPPADRIVTLEM